MARRRAVPVREDETHEEDRAEQTDNTERPEDGEQVVSQDPAVDYSRVST